MSKLKNLKKFIIISVCILTAIIVANVNQKIFIINTEQLLPLLFTLLGLCITAYTFIYTPINELIKGNMNELIMEDLNKLLKSYEDDMMLIFILSIVIIILDIVNNINIPIVKDIQIEKLNIVSLKMFMYNFFVSLSAMLSFYALYDLIKATFRILRKSFDRN